MELRVYLGVDPVSGKQRYASRTVRAGKREAQRVLNERITEAERGLAVRRSASVGELLEAWFRVGVRRLLALDGEGDAWLPVLRSVPLSRFRASDFDKRYRRMIAGGRQLSPATVRRIRSGDRRRTARWQLMPITHTTTHSSLERRE